MRSSKPLVLALALCGCAPAAAYRAPSAEVERQPPWESLSWEQRHDRMTWVVHPQMARLFQSFRATAAPELTCRTCHGADAEQAAYKMPRGLPRLDPARLPDPNGSQPDARIAKFMAEQVTPTMADLLGVDRFDPRTGRGFGCFGCHPSSR